MEIHSFLTGFHSFSVELIGMHHMVFSILVTDNYLLLMSDTNKITNN